MSSGLEGGCYNITKLVNVKVNCTLVQALRLCTGRTAHRGSRGIALPFHDHGTRRVWGVYLTPRSLFTPGKDPVPIVQEAGWAPGPVWTGAENLASTEIRSPDHPTRSSVAIPTTLPGQSPHWPTGKQGFYLSFWISLSFQVTGGCGYMQMACEGREFRVMFSRWKDTH